MNRTTALLKLCNVIDYKRKSIRMQRESLDVYVKKSESTEKQIGIYRNHICYQEGVISGLLIALEIFSKGAAIIHDSKDDE